MFYKSSSGQSEFIILHIEHVWSPKIFWALRGLEIQKSLKNASQWDMGDLPNTYGETAQKQYHCFPVSQQEVSKYKSRQEIKTIFRTGGIDKLSVKNTVGKEQMIQQKILHHKHSNHTSNSLIWCLSKYNGGRKVLLEILISYKTATHSINKIRRLVIIL